MYLYILNRPSLEEEIARLEFSHLTGCDTDKGIGLCDVYIDSSRPAYVEACIEVYFIENDLDLLYKDIESMKYCMDKYRVRFLNTLVHVDFDTRKGIERNISDIFEGCPDLKNPLDDFIMTYTGTQWIFGKLLWNTKNRWLIYHKKPYTFCSSLPARMARALVNIAARDNLSIKLIDPCCGMGTVVLEALDMGIDTYGCDINENVVQNANKNLVHFGFKPLLECRDATDIEGFFDVSIVDLPYGVLSTKGSDMYREIIQNLRRICSRAVILSGGDISSLIRNAGFEITGGCIVHKGGLDRHIVVCK